MSPAASQQYCEVGTISSISQMKPSPLNNLPKLIQRLSGKPVFEATYWLRSPSSYHCTVLFISHTTGALSSVPAETGTHLSFTRYFSSFPQCFTHLEDISGKFQKKKKNPHIFSWTNNMLTLLQYFCQQPVLALPSLYPCLYLWSSPVVRCENAEVRVKGAVSCCSESHQFLSQSRPGIHAEGEMNLAPTLSGTLLPRHWNSTVYEQCSKKTLENSFCNFCL